MTSKERLEEIRKQLEKTCLKNCGHGSNENCICLNNQYANLEHLEKDLEELEYQKRKNADLLETIKCIKNHAMIKKTKGLGIEVIASFHSNDEDFEKVGWVFDIIKF